MNKRILLAAVVAMLPTAGFAQNALKCPPAGTVVTYADGGRTTYKGQQGNRCRMEITQPNGSGTESWLYGPGFQTNDRNDKSFVEQVKPERIWPLTVGKVVKARYEGEGTTPGYKSRWDHTWTIEKAEKITTKAGTFDTIVVLWQNEQLPPSNWKATIRQWYVPELGLFVKFDYSDNQNQSSSKRSSEAVSITRP